MKKNSLVIGVLLVLSLAVSAEKLADLAEITRPTSLAMDDSQFYITDGHEIFIYSLKDYRFVTKFGKAGEGPQEFKVGQGGNGFSIYPQTDQLVVNSLGKISFFTRDGKFIKEIATKSSNFPHYYQPIGDKFAGLDFNFGENQSITMAASLYDSQLKKIKTIHEQKFMQRGAFEFPVSPPIFYVVKDKIIMGGEQGLVINIFNEKGEKLSTIQKEYKLLKVTDEYKKGVHEFFKTNPATKQFYEIIKNQLKFSEEFPAIQQFFVADQKIYVHTYLKENGRYEFLVFDFPGKLLKRLFLPLEYMDGLRPSPMTIRHNKLFQLRENIDEEMWELHATPIE